MKIVKSIFDGARPRFEKGGKLEKWAPLFEASETFFFIPGLMARVAPFVRDSLDLKRFMTLVIVALQPLLLFGIFNAGHQANLAAGLEFSLVSVLLRGCRIVLPLVIVSYGVGFLWEILFAVVRKDKISEGFLVTGLLFPLILPPSTPLWQAALGISFGVVIGKEIFGGTGRNILNPALTGRAFLFFAYPGSMSGDAIWVAAGDKAVDAVSGATALAISAMTEAPEGIEAALARADYSFASLLLGYYPGCVGETSALLCLLAALFLIVVGVASYRIILGGVLGACAAGLLLNLFAADGSMAWYSLNPLYHLVMGGFAFGITFMATDPVSSPGMNGARWVYGAAIGALTILIRVFNPAYAEGVMLAILFMNLFAPLLDHIEIKIRLKKRTPNV